MNYRDLPFYPNETVVGHVVALNDGLAVVKVRGWQLPLQKQFITWDVIKTAKDVLSIGERIQVVVQTENLGQQVFQRRAYFFPTIFWHGFWLNRLPLLTPPEEKFKHKYPEGSLLEVEFMEYINFYTARAKMPDGSIVELLLRDIHPKKNNSNYQSSIDAGQYITLRVKRFKERTLLGKRIS